ncbi:2707_t:CDS:1, partial [Cetraspora pellucida]
GGSTPKSSSVPPSSPFPATSTSSPLKTAETKKKQLKAVIANLETISDKTPTQETQLTNKKQELKEVEELETIIKYFLENSIKKITIEDEKLIIEYSNGTKKTVEVDTNQLKTIRDKMRKVNKNSLLASELGLDYASNPSNQKENKGTNYTPWIIGGSIVGGIALVGGIIFLLTRGRKKTRKQL